jgi:hypothetical protein
MGKALLRYLIVELGDAYQGAVEWLTVRIEGSYGMFVFQPINFPPRLVPHPVLVVWIKRQCSALLHHYPPRRGWAVFFLQRDLELVGQEQSR